MTDHANELRRYARKIGHPAGDVPSVMPAAADEIERLQAKVDAAEKSDAESIAMYRKARDERDELLDRLEAAEKERDALRNCLDEWFDKTEWVQQGVNEGTISAKHLGRHRANVIASLLDEAKKERDDLRVKVAEMERQEPVGVLHVGNYYGEELQDWEFEANQCACDKLNEVYVSNPTSLPLYAIPGAQNIPEKLCYDSRWEISIDYVDGWNAAVDMMRGKSPSWHCPDCCIAFPFGAPEAKP